MLKAFPDVALFIEKPIATAPVASCYALAEYLEKQKTIASVGYMLRCGLPLSPKARVSLRRRRKIPEGDPAHASDHRGDGQARHGRRRTL